jgi:hypothetical protein
VTEDEKPEETTPRESEKPRRSTDDEEIDEALEETFPASDPPAFIAGLPKTE